MKTITLREWQIKMLASLPPGVDGLIVLPLDQPPHKAFTQVSVNNGLATFSAPGVRGIATIPCPLGAVGERVAVYKDGTQMMVAGGFQARCHISLTAEPEVKLLSPLMAVIETMEGNPLRAGDWAWFCRVRRA